MAIDFDQQPKVGEEGNPILDALPPKSDYMTYLTILEYQLTSDRLPSLQRVLEEDSENALTENIGWDLVQLLLPMLPQSEGCLDLVARKGNPKEVIIRVTEALEKMANDALSGNESEEGEDYDAKSEGLKTFDGEAERIHLGAMKLDGMPETTNDLGLQGIKELETNDNKLSNQRPATPSLPLIQFITLLSMLSILHPRIQTKNPSRFLATSLQAVLRAYRGLVMPSATAKLVELLTKLSGRQRPALPPRTSTADVSNSAVVDSEADFVTAPLPDPEQESGDMDSATVESDKAIVRKLLQAVALEVFEDFVLDATTTQETNLGWTARLREQLEPKKNVPGRKTETERFRAEKDLRSTDLIVEKLVRLCSVLDLNHPSSFSQLFSGSILTSATEEQDGEEPSTPREYPTSPSEIPFSSKGLLFYISALSFDSVLSYYKDIPAPAMSPQVFPDLSNLLMYFVKTSSFGLESLAQCPVSVLDAILSLFYLAIHNGKLGAYPSSLDQFQTHTWLPILYLSALHPTPEIRFFAYLISTQLLHKHPDSKSRLALIRATLSASDSSADTRQSAVLEPLRSVAVGWLKTEVQNCLSIGSDDGDCILAHEQATTELPALLFPEPPPLDASGAGQGDGGEEDLEQFISRLGFYATTLNFGYYLMSIDGARARSNPAVRQLKSVYSAERCERLRGVMQGVRRRAAVVKEDDDGLDMELTVCEYALEQVESKG